MGAGRIGSAAAAALLAGCAVAALAGGSAARARGGDDGDPSHRVSFQVERTRDVANDWAQAVIGVTDEDPDAAALADRVNRAVAWGLGIAREHAEIRVKSAGYQTHPVYEQSRIRRWRASQDLILETADVEVLSELLGKLQSRMQLRSIGFTVSPERRRQVEDELIGEALEAFQARAALVRAGFGARSHQLIQASIDTQGDAPPSPHVRMLSAEGAGRASVAPPALEEGESRLLVRVHGTIELE